jgi:expansin (peptidoglycan-binding protein)
MTVTKDQLDLDLMKSRRVFAVAQEAFAGAVLRVAAADATIGWHSTDLHPETGSVALVREDGDFADLVGEVISVTRRLPTETRVVYAYVLGTASILDDLSLARRAFMGLGILTNEQLSCSIEVIA